MRRVGRSTTSTNLKNKYYSNNVIKSNTYYTPNPKQLQPNTSNTTSLSNTSHTNSTSPSFKTPGIPIDLNDSLIINENINQNNNLNNNILNNNSLVTKSTTLEPAITNNNSHTHSNTFPDRPKDGIQNQTL